MTIFTTKNRIMFGVYLMYSMRKLQSPFVAESFAFAALALILSVFVSVPSVLSNMLDSSSFYRYFMISFANTEFLVQAVLIATAATFLFFVRNLTFHAILKTHSA